MQKKSMKRSSLFVACVVGCAFLLGNMSLSIAQETGHSEGGVNHQEAAPVHGTQTNPVDVTRVEVKFVLDEIRNINITAATYGVVAEVLQQWQDDGSMREALGNPEAKVILTGDQVNSLHDSVFLPEFFVANAEGARETMVRSLVLYPEGTIDLFEKFAVDVTLDSDMHSYPFGALDLHLELEAFTDDISGLEFVSGGFEVGHASHSDEAAHGGGVIKGNWTAIDHFVRSNTMSSMNLGGHDKFSNISYHVEVQHDVADILQKIIIPLVVVVLLSLAISHFCSLQFPDNADWSIGGQITLILTIFALKFSLGDDVPKTHFLTMIDALMIGSSTLISLALFAGIYLNDAFQRESKTAHALEARWNILLPLAAIAMAVWVASFVV